MGRYLIVNGEMTESSNIGLGQLLSLQPFSLQKKIWFGFTGIPLFNQGITELTNSARELNLKLPAFFDNHRELYRQLKRMLHKNRFYRSGIISIQVFWYSEGVDYLISSKAFYGFDFPIMEAGLLLNFSELSVDKLNPLSRYTFQHEQLWNIQLLRLRKSTWHNSVILNNYRHIAEVAGSNIYLIKEKKLITPSIESGCYFDSLRPFVLETASQTGLEVIESQIIEEESVFKTDEIFLASEAQGIQSVLGIESKRYMRRYCFEIHRILNLRLKEIAESIQ